MYIAFHLLLDLTYFYAMLGAKPFILQASPPELLMAILRNVREPGTLYAMFKVHEHEHNIRVNREILGC